MASAHHSEPTWRGATVGLLRASIVLLALALEGCAQTTASGDARTGEKHVVVDKAAQELIAYEGDKVVLRSRVSTGRMGRRTPSGKFSAGVKLRMHYSRLYDNAPMPFSVQVNGNYFIHGFTSVPNRPASHGCIRLPLTGDNPAKQFFEWVEPGTPIEIVGEWTSPPPPPRPARRMPATAESANPKKPADASAIR